MTDLNTLLAYLLEEHPEIETVSDIPRHHRKAVLIAYRDETSGEVLADIYRGDAFPSDEAVLREEQISKQAWRCLEGRDDDVAEFQRLVSEHLWKQSEDKIDEALQDVRQEAVA